MDRKYIALLILLVLAIFTRFFGIEFQSLWADEGATYYYSHYTWEQFKSVSEPNSPIFYIMEGWFLDTLGHSEFALRFISAIAGIVTVMMSYFVADKLFKNWRFAIFVAVLFLISMYCMEYSQEARGYGLVLMFFMFQFYAFLCMLEATNTISKILLWALIIVFGFMAFLMQYVAILSTVTLVLYSFYVYYKEMQETGNYKPLLSLGIVCIGAIIASIPFWGIANDVIVSRLNTEHWIWCMTGPIYTGEVFYKFLCKIPIVSIFMFVLMILGILYCRKSHKQEYNLLLWVMLFPLILTTILSFFTNMTPRYIIWSIPPYLIFVALSFYYWGTDKESLKRANTVAVVSVILVAGTVLPCYYMEPTKSDFRGSASEISVYATEGDTVVYSPGGDEWRCMIYGAFSFYYDASAHGVKTIPYESEEQLIELSKDPSNGKIFVLIENIHDPYAFLNDHRSDTCVNIFSGYTNYVFMITAPL